MRDVLDPHTHGPALEQNPARRLRQLLASRRLVLWPHSLNDIHGVDEKLLRIRVLHIA